MSRRASRGLYGAAALIAVLAAAGFLLLRGWGSGDPPLTPAPVWSDGVRLVVGKPVQVSKANGTLPHWECVVAADPGGPARLLVAAIYSSEKWGKPGAAGKTVPTRGIAGYYSEDGGGTWHVAFERRGDPQNSFIDPALAFGPDGSAQFVCMRLRTEAWEGRDVFVGDAEAGRLDFTRSPDGGKTWGPTTSVPPYIDRPWIAVDCTQGPYRGRFYCLGNFGSARELFVFPDADTAKAPRKVSFPKKKGLPFDQSSNLVVLSDGAVVWVNDERGGDNARRPVATVHLSDDGGRTFADVGRVNTGWRDPRLLTTNRLFFPHLAADALGTAYRDRLYYVWEDGGDEARVLFSSSAARGRTWTAPLVLSEQSTGVPPGQDYNAFMPCVAVNKQGAVAVSWYDRRGLPPGTSGYQVRMRVSVDGGASWSPSVQLNEKVSKGSAGSLGDTAGLTADAAGNFHPVWIDDCTGTRQVWTATVRVKTNGGPSGAGEESAGDHSRK